MKCLTTFLPDDGAGGKIRPVHPKENRNVWTILRDFMQHHECQPHHGTRGYMNGSQSNLFLLSGDHV